MPPPPVPQKHSIVSYKPRPSSRLAPLTPQEIHFYNDPEQSRRGWFSLSKKRKRSLADERDSKRSKDAESIRQHYDARPEVERALRRESPIIGLKNFNNWIKSVLFANFCHPALELSPVVQRPRLGAKKGSTTRGRVLDMGCGKGGDLNKWAKAHISEYVGLDVASVSIEQARQRYESFRGPRFDATFAACDCYSVSISTALDPGRLSTPFDVVSLQFCMHYAFETEERARRMLDNVSRWLRSGGIFVGTIPNSGQLLSRLRGSPNHSFGNSVYNIRTEAPVPSDNELPKFGFRYVFWLKDAVENVPEFLVLWDDFVRLAEEYKLVLKYRKEFHDMFTEFSEHPDFGPLMTRMQVVDAQGDSKMDEEQWEAASEFSLVPTICVQLS
ncbi:guanine-N(7)-methyltransferase [Thelephora terrestris]|uniref:mRNA cap guanine-N(7) methyltransferase n=1 Tax=Thelephora terrestris TaxID=56493 RepID=A0A9P6LC95_9AGAM|nr:guanine-N(7)-methyltransferase [Thelephora terrestris]